MAPAVGAEKKGKAAGRSPRRGRREGPSCTTNPKLLPGDGE